MKYYYWHHQLTPFLLAPLLLLTFLGCEPCRARPIVSNDPTAAALNYHNLLDEATKHAQNDQLLEAARKIRRAMNIGTDTTTPTPTAAAAATTRDLDASHERILQLADRIEKTILDISSTSPDPKIWTKHKESEDNHRTNGKQQRDAIHHYYRLCNQKLTSRIEFLIDKSLLVPILAVLSETELFDTWIPRWKFPPVGVSQVRKLAQTGRTNQILHAELDIPMKRDIIFVSTGVDDLEGSGLFALHLGTCPEDEEIQPSGIHLPPPEHGVVRVDFEGCFVFRKCPRNHPLFLNRIHNEKTQQQQQQTKESKTTHIIINENNNSNNGNDNTMVLVSFSMFADPKISVFVPQWIINFVIRVAIVQLFRVFLNVAEDVHAGKRPDHTAAIAKKREEIYDWIDERVNAMLRMK